MTSLISVGGRIEDDKRTKSQLCWRCINTSDILCTWFSDGELPEGAVRDRDGFIVACPKFVLHGREIECEDVAKSELYTMLGDKYGVTLRTVWRYVARYGNDFEEKLKKKYKNRTKVEEVE